MTISLAGPEDSQAPLKQIDIGAGVVAARCGKTLPDAYRLARFEDENGVMSLKLQGYFTWTQGWSQRGGEWRDIETVDWLHARDGEPYGPLL
jgi:hypothetical protein